MRLPRIQIQFLFLIGMFLFLTLLLNWMPKVQQNADETISIRYNVNMPISKAVRNLSSQTVKRTTYKSNVWKPHASDDRIVSQLALKPKIDNNLPAKKIFLEHGVDGWGVKNGKETFIEHKCPIQNCELVSFPSSADEKIDARMFKEIDLSGFLLDEIERETKRHPDQVWIMFGLESPEASPNYMGMENKLNWTATYRHDSTIVTPYDKWVPFDNFTSIDGIVPERNFAKGKTKFAAVFVSNCNSANNRLAYIHEMQKHIEVDIFGFCGDHECSHDRQDSCFEMLRNDYKFYLSFENANCRDYITEKLFLNALRNEVLPVVMGAHPDDYKRVAPPGSYIHVEDFSGPEELSKYLMELAKNDDEYNQYFRWRNTGSFIDTKFWCRICSMLWDPKRPTLFVPNLNEWWRSPGTCIGKERWTPLGVEH